VNSFILHEGFIVGYLFALLGVALFILQSINSKIYYFLISVNKPILQN
jgi:hypothetical protein